MRSPEHFSAVYWIIRDANWKILFQRRANSWFNDGILQFPSGHIEWEETYFQALLREMKEEINIEFKKSDVKLVHVLHRINTWERVYFDVFFEIQNYTWEIQNLEPDKCSELGFFDANNGDITPYNIEILEHIEKWVSLSEIIM